MLQSPPCSSAVQVISHHIMFGCLARVKPRAISGSNCQSSGSYVFTLIAVTGDGKYAGISGHQHGAVQNQSTIHVEFLVDGKWSAPQLFIADNVVPADTVRVRCVTESRPTKLKFTNSNIDGWGFKALALKVGTAETEIPVPLIRADGPPGGWVKPNEYRNAELAIPPAAATQPGQSISPEPENKSEAKVGEVEELRTWPYRFVLQQDGNLILFQEGAANSVWHSGTRGKGEAPFEHLLQGDGNLVVYDKNGVATWASGSRGNKCVLRVQVDGSVVIYGDDGHPKWSTNTHHSHHKHNCSVACHGKTGDCGWCGKHRENRDHILKYQDQMCMPNGKGGVDLGQKEPHGPSDLICSYKLPKSERSMCRPGVTWCYNNEERVWDENGVMHVKVGGHVVP